MDIDIYCDECGKNADSCYCENCFENLKKEKESLESDLNYMKDEFSKLEDDYIKLVNQNEECKINCKENCPNRFKCLTVAEDK